MTKEEVVAGNQREDEFWFCVDDILNFKDSSDVNDYLIDNDLLNDANKEQKRFANKTLYKLYTVIHDRGTISPYVEKTDDLDKVLNIFMQSI